MTTNQESGDEILVRQVLDGDTELFATLITRHKHMVFAAVGKHVPYQEVEEVAQEVFIRAYQSLPTFRGESQFKTWLGSIAVRTSYDFWRKRYRNKEMTLTELSPDNPDWLDHALNDTAEAAAEAEPAASELLNWALDRLSAEDRMVVQLMYFEERSVRECAGLLGWSQANVKVRAFRARGRLKKLMREMESGNP